MIPEGELSMDDLNALPGQTNPLADGGGDVRVSAVENDFLRLLNQSLRLF